MPNYRDVDAGLRIDTLEAKLAERDAAVAARDAELKELRAGFAGARRGGASDRARKGTRFVAIGGVLAVAALGFALASTRRDLAREEQHVRDTIDMSRTHQVHADKQLAEANEKLLACTTEAGTNKIPGPHAYFGTPSDRAAIELALDSAAHDASRCHVFHGETGVGRVHLIFDPMQGNVESASVDFGPFVDAGISECVLAAFRRVHVDAFKGTHVTLTKEFTIK
ncbi:MAG: hypothetical protein ABJE95_07420 [Byssovorax sp.]